MGLCSVCETIEFEHVPALPKHLDAGYSSPWKGLIRLSSNLYFAKARKNGEATEGEEELKKEAITQPLGVPFHKSFDELGVAAEHCSICSLVRRGVADCLAALEEAQKDSIYNYYKRRKQSSDPEGPMWLARRPDGSDGFIVICADGDYNAWLLAGIAFCVEEDDPLSKSLPGRIIQKDSRSEKSVARTLDWVSECNDHHTSPRCSFGDEELPKRVLDLGLNTSSDSIKLFETNGEVGKYTALSHMWGQHRHFITTKASIHAHKQNISISDLPATFQDAVNFTRRLGVRYLWIDSICICQDDGPDWERESARMAQIYTNAYLVLAATGSSSDSAGFFIERSPPEYTNFEYTWNGTKGTIYASLTSSDDSASEHSGESIDNDPLSKRGWALQERFLARRTLHSGSKQFAFECSQQYKSEDGFRGKSRFNELAAKDEDESESTYRGPTKWHNLLNDYYPRKLTKESDKLPAISGIVRAFSQKYNDEYVAGLWRSNLMEGLLWQAMGASTGNTSRPTEYRAPSWSWASMDGPFGNLGVGRDFLDPTARWIDVAEIGDCHVELKGENPYGEVTDGYITITAPLERLEASGEKERDWETVPHKRAFRAKTKNGLPFGAYCMFDTIDDDAAAKLELFALILVRRMTVKDEPDDRTYQAILITPVEGEEEGVYRRVGKWLPSYEDLGECDWMEDKTKRTTVKLI
ncbi:HET-domain-containing protein [Aaosphaeria arxii CBS 175.79]|uniref:HET-domain-containing protein n=1 Tax=Aaosphaeria arxii CBS 175.79 TaxID=1450172 RepID=A0A6A5XS80_9PLEO|nr:HET-domain-containing protein [Aaosphaeria arxii CBS 175.79]KAF2016195.1 HET-domain-containing protein [Aaosphaeria arxii CBS 175.79]